MTPMYEWLKALHILSLIAWMAGLFYLPRLFVYHATEVVGGPTNETFKVMERRLLGAIMRPACIATLVTGVGLWRVAGFAFTETWFLMKIAGVAGMFAFHGLLEAHCAQFMRDERIRPARYFRIINEVPTLLLIWIVVWVVVRPFT